MYTVQTTRDTPHNTTARGHRFAIATHYRIHMLKRVANISHVCHARVVRRERDDAMVLGLER